jgi:hypothetical protein
MANKRNLRVFGEYLKGKIRQRRSAGAAVYSVFRFTYNIVGCFLFSFDSSPEEKREENQGNESKPERRG